MTNEPLDAFDRDLQTLLRVEPSAEFMAGVHARIVETPPSRSAWWWRTPALAAGLAGLFLARTALRTTPAPAPAPRVVAVAPPRPAPAATPGKAHPVPAARVTTPPSRRAPTRPEVIVPADGERTLMAFVAANARGAHKVPPLTASSTSDELLAPPAAIDIAPLETVPLPDPAAVSARSDS